MGLWYGIEIISHKPETNYQDDPDAICPVIHISKDVYNDTFNERYYEQTYGADYGYKRDYSGKST